ncbi:MAG: NDP-sugar synthase [Acidobacteria bacterium]|nr:MAG: NDP-sugar synthase [Acidobacteriota bacterium]
MSFEGAAMVLAAGRGVRMRPLTDARAKPTLPVLGMSLLERIVRFLAAEGIRAVAVNAHHAAASVRACLDRCSDLPVQRELFVEPELMGSGGAFVAPRSLLACSESFLVHNGDTLVRAPVEELAHAAQRPDTLGALLVRPGRVPGYRPVLVRDGRVVGLSGDAAAQVGEPATYLGVAVFRRAVLDAVPPDRPSELFGDVLLPLVARGMRLAAVPYRGPWLEFTSPPDYRRKLVRLVLESRERGSADLPGGPAPCRPVPEGCCFFGEGAVAADSRLAGGVVLERGARVIGSSVSDSVLLEQAQVGPGSRLERAVVAAGSRVSPGTVVRDTVHGSEPAREKDR